MIIERWFFLTQVGTKEATLSFNGYELRDIYKGLRVILALSQYEDNQHSAINKIIALNEEDFREKKDEEFSSEIKSKTQRIMDILKE